MKQNLVVEKIYDLTPMQEGMLFHSIHQASSKAYIELSDITLSGKIDLEVLEETFQYLVNRHDVLKTIFLHEKVAKPRQVVLKERKANIHLEDFSNFPDANERADAFLQQEKSKTFNLSKDLLIRLNVLILAPEKTRIIWGFHHIVMDGWCFTIILQEFFVIYQAKINKETIQLPQPIPFATYLKWLDAQNKDEAATFWKNQLGEIESLSPVNVNSSEFPMQYQVENHFFLLSEKHTEEINKLVQRQHISLNTYFQTMWALLLQKRNGSTASVFGTVVSGRPKEISQVNSIIGLFINTIPVRADYSMLTTLNEAFDYTNEFLIQSKQYDYFPLAELLQFTPFKTNLFDHLLVFQNTPVQENSVNDESKTGFVVEYIKAHEEIEIHFNAHVFPTDEQLKIKYNYNALAFSADEINKLESQFRSLIEQSLANPKVELAALKILSETEIQQQLVDFNQTSANYPSDVNLVDLFETQVRLHPEQTAVVFGDLQLSYAELNARANQLARHLLTVHEIQADDLIGMLVDRSELMLVGILAILKTGAAYVPIDPDYPAERIGYTLEDAACKILLTSSEISVPESFSGSVVLLDDASIYAGDASNLELSIAPSDLAYIIYTSGSTGKPKGVMIEHANVVRLLFNDQNRFSFSASDVWTLFHSYCFDFSVWEMYGAILYGGKLIVVPKIVAQNTVEFRNLVEQHEVTVLNQTPGSFYNFAAEELSNADRKLKLRSIIFGGEALLPAKLSEWKKTYPEVKLINMYGITETTVHVTYKEITSHEIEAGTSNIGVPLPTLTTYILDQQQNLVPLGVPGELCVGGLGLARGYLNRPDLTAAAFIDHPFEKNQRLYRSGDLAKWLPNGELEYLGRIDQQVKIRGYRIELGEIETALLKHKHIQEAVVLAKKDPQQNSYLQAYLVSPNQEITVQELRAHLAQYLPDYMIPSYFVSLEKIPLTPNGKVDRKALPEADGSIQSGTEYVAPRNETERILCEIWQEILGIDRIGVLDNFFELGGQSLKATQVVSRIQKKLNIEIGLRDFFLKQSISELATWILTDSVNRKCEIEHIEKQEYYDLSYTQRGFWVSEKMHLGDDFKIALSIRLKGKLKIDAFSNAFSALIQGHESFRTHFIEVDGIPKQVISDEIPFEIAYMDLSSRLNPEHEAVKLAEEEAEKPFDLSNAPLIRASLLRLNQEEHAFLFTIHHIITDGWSMDLMIDEVLNRYNAETNQQQLNLNAPSFRYIDYAAWENEALSEKRLVELKNFWNKHLSGSIEHLPLLIDKIRPKQASFEGKSIYFRLNDTENAQLMAFALEHKITLNTLLLSVFNLFLAKITRRDEISIRTISTGRNQQELEAIIGVFVKTYCIKNHPTAEKLFSEFIHEVQERSLAVQEHNHYPFDLIIADFTKQESENRNVANVGFALQNLDTLRKNKEVRKIGNLEVSTLEVEELTAKNDLLLIAQESDMDLQFCFNYSTDLFFESKIELFIVWFKNLLREVVIQPETKLADFTLSKGTENELFDYLELSSQEFELIHPLSSVQRDLYLDSVINKAALAHNLALIIKPQLDLEIDLWIEAVNKVIQKTDTLRSRIIQKNEELYVAVKRESNIFPKILDFRNRELTPEILDEIIFKEVKAPYDFASEALMRHLIFRIDEKRYYIVVGAHHSIIDGWSYKLFFEQASQIYLDLLGKVNEQYSTDSYFATSVERQLSSFDTGDVKRYWKNKLSDLESLDFKPISKPKGALITKIDVLDQAEVDVISNYCKQEKISVSLYFKALFAYVIKHYCHTEQDFTINEVIANRNEENMTSMGCFYHAIPVRIDNTLLESDAPVSSYFEYVKQQKKELGNKQNISAFLKSNLIGEEKTVFFYNNQLPFTLKMFETELEMETIMSYSENQVHLVVRETQEGLKIFLFYYDHCFEDFDMIERICSLSKQITSGTKTLNQLQLSSPEELKTTLKNPWNEVNYPKDKTLHQVIEEAAEQFSDRIAVRFENTDLSYRELNERANQLAHFIRSKKIIEADERIALMLERSEHMIVAMLAILKSGAAYVPIDPNYPKERIEYMLQDCGATLLISESSFQNLIPEIKLEIISLDLEREAIQEHMNGNLPNTCSPENLAYIIYTSGTTGQPKGTMIEHRNVVRLLVNDSMPFDFNEHDTWSFFHSFCFDFSVWEIFTPLVYGAKILVVSKDCAQDTEQFLELLIAEKVSVLNQIPNIFSKLVELALTKYSSNPLQLRYVIFGGDALKPASLKAWKERYPQTKLINMYGITETTVHVTYKEIGDQEIEAGLSNIGQVIPTLTSYIMDKHLNLLPIGIPGEICVGGAGVARGYLNKAELSAQKFVQHPYKTDERIYRSGDLGRLLPSGDIEYLGRIDQQVKIRGYRIELGEIENALQSHPEITLAVVLVKELNTGNPELIAYYESSSDLNNSILREYLQSSLPEYMIPSYFVAVEEFPITPNGKLDKKALPNPQLSEIKTGSVYEEATNETERKIVRIWSQVLGLEKIGVLDNFFVLGGHSLKAVQLISLIHKTFDVELSIKDFFAHPTVKALAELVSKANLSEYSRIELLPEQEHYEASPAQRRLWLLDQINEGSVDYNMPDVFTFTQEIDPLILEQAFAQLIQRHEILRTNLIQADGIPVQKIHPNSTFKLKTLDLSGDPQFEHKIKEIYFSESKYAFQLDSDHLIRACLLKEHSDSWHLILVMHHIISDGWSMGILKNELTQIYEAISEQKAFPLPELRVQYKDYAAWQNQQLQGNRLLEHQTYWHETLAGELPVLELPTDGTEADLSEHSGSRYNYLLDRETSSKIKQLAQKNHSSMFMTLLAAFNIFMQRLSGQNDILIGTPVAGREHEELKNLIGFFLNTVMLRSKIDVDSSFETYLLEVRNSTLEALQHQSYPFEQLLDELKIPRNVNRFPISSVFFNMANFETGKLSEIDEFEAHHDAHQNKVKFDLNFYVNEYENGLTISCDYKNELFRPETIEAFIEKYVQILASVSSHPEQKIRSIRTKLTTKEPSTAPEQHWYNPNHSLADFISANWKNYGEQIAVKDHSGRLTYAELDTKTTALAAFLLRKFEAKSRIGICVSHDRNMALGVITCLKAGFVYIPLDPDYPKDRLQFILQDSSASAILTDLEHADLVATLGNFSPENTICIDQQDATHWKETDEVLQTKSKAEDEAYILYTSGSTGQPKGAIQTHRAILHFISAYSSALNIQSSDVLSGFSSISYDSFVNDLFGALLNGACYCPLSLKSGLSYAELGDWTLENKLTIWHSVPSVSRQFCAEMSLSKQKFEHLRIVKMTGEASIKQDFEQFKGITLPHAQFVVSYGSTESTLNCIKLLNHEHETEKAVISPGFAVKNTEIRIHNELVNESDVLESGEIWIHSPYLIQEYLNNESLNREAFTEIDHKRYYKSGDLGRMMPDGSLQIIGRKDQQVKIRGMRIELQEIENTLLKHPAVEQVAVLIKANEVGEKQVWAYLVLQESKTSKELRKFILQTLPEHFVPHHFVQLEALPLTPNGKIDRQKLIDLRENFLESGTEFVAAQTDTEEKLTALWKESLGKQEIGIHDHYFELGGHSLKATQLISKIHKTFDVQLRLKELFLNPTIASLAQVIDRLEKSTYSEIPKLEPAAHYEVSHAQKRLWLLDKLDEHSANYNMSKALIFEGQLNTEAFQSAFNKLLIRHESLRTNFIEVEGEPRQIVHETRHLKFDFTEAAQSHESDDELLELVQQESNTPFDLEKDLLIRCKLIRLEAEKHLFVCTMHHIISDGTSMEILARDLLQLYGFTIAGEHTELPPLKIQYTDFAVWQNHLLSTEEVGELEHFWNQQLKHLPALNLPTDKPRPDRQTFNGNIKQFKISEQYTSDLYELCKAEKTTLFMLLHANVSMLLAKYSGQHDFAIGSPLAGRNHASLQEQIGFFINTLVLRCKLNDQDHVREIIQRSKQVCLDAFEHQEYPFDLLVNRLSGNRDLSRSPIFDVALVLQNTESSNQNPIRFEGIRVRPLETKHQSSKFDLTFNFYEDGDELIFSIEYNTDLFEDESIELMGMRLHYLLENIGQNMDLLLGELTVSSVIEQELEDQNGNLDDGFEF